MKASRRRARRSTPRRRGARHVRPTGRAASSCRTRRARPRGRAGMRRRRGGGLPEVFGRPFPPRQAAGSSIRARRREAPTPRRRALLSHRPRATRRCADRPGPGLTASRARARSSCGRAAACWRWPSCFAGSGQPLPRQYPSSPPARTIGDALIRHGGKPRANTTVCNCGTDRSLSGCAAAAILVPPNVPPPPADSAAAEPSGSHGRSRFRPCRGRDVVIRVVLADDSFLAREGIRRALEAIDDVDLVASCGDLDELRSTVERVEPDVVVTDIRMPPTNTDEGIRFARELRGSLPDAGVVVLSQHAEPSYAMSLFEDGSNRRAYLLKERVKDKDELARALRDVAAGGSLVDSRIVDTLVSGRLNDPGVEKLTPREREILAMIAEGRSNAAIADSLEITKRAVERHINGIFLKLDLGEAEDVNRRVKATLLYLTGGGG